MPDIKLLPSFPILSRVFVQGEPDYNRNDKSLGGTKMAGPAAPKDPEKARPYFYILKDKDIFGERQKDGSGVQFIYESDGRLINSAQITGNVTDEEELRLLETVEGFGRLVHSIGVSVETDQPEENAEFVFQMYGKKDLYGGGTNLTTFLRCDGMEHRIFLSD